MIVMDAFSEPWRTRWSSDNPADQFTVDNPATGRPIVTIQGCGAAEVDQAVRAAWGNASSVHHFGQQAKAVVDEARSAVAALLGGEASEVIFTSGGS